MKYTAGGELVPNERKQAEKLTSEHLRAIRAEAGAKGMANRWAAYRAERIAQGLPPTRDEELGRKPRRLMDPEVRAYWRERVVALGIDAHEAEIRGIDKVTHRQLDRLAQILSETETERLADSPAGDHEDKLAARIAFHRSEVKRWRRRIRQEKALIGEHERFMTEHENTLTDLLIRGLDE